MKDGAQEWLAEFVVNGHGLVNWAGLEHGLGGSVFGVLRENTQGVFPGRVKGKAEVK